MSSVCSSIEDLCPYICLQVQGPPHSRYSLLWRRWFVFLTGVVFALSLTKGIFFPGDLLHLQSTDLSLGEEVMTRADDISKQRLEAQFQAALVQH